MANFIYKVKDEKGVAHTGVYETEDVKSLRTKLHDQGWYIIHIRTFREKRKFRFFKRTSLDDLIMFTHQLCSMLEAGIPILNALDIIWKQVDNPEFQIVISQVRNRLAGGVSLRDAFADFPDVFPGIYCALLGVADTGASLAKIMRSLLGYLNDQREFIFKLKRAMTYPIIVVGFAVLVVILMLLWVIPTFQKVFIKVNIELPVFTKVIITVASVMRSFWFLAVMMIILPAFLIFYRKFSKTARAKIAIAKFKLKMPIFGKIIYAAIVSRLVRSLSLLIGGGLTIVKSIEVVKETALNVKISEALEQVRKRIIEGAPLGVSLDETGAFPAFLVEMISVGEKSGTMVEMLDRMTVYFEEEFDFRLNRFLTLLEPLLIILVGGLVIFILLAIYLPILKLWGGISGMG